MATFMSASSASPADTPGLRTLSPSQRTSRVVAVALLTLLAVLLFTSVRQESQTFDESTHLYAGFEYLKHADFGVNPEHPPLAKMLAALPLLSMGLKEPQPFPFPYFKANDFMDGARFLYGGDADAMLLRGRMVLALLCVGLAGLVYLAASEIFGPLAGLIALGLFVFEPVVLANGALVTTDMPLTCFFFATFYAFYRFLKRPSFGRLALCAAAAGLAMAVKHSGALVLPILLLLGAADNIAHRFPSRALPDDVEQPRHLKLLPLAGALAVIGVIAWGLLWAVYGFRYAARPGQTTIVPPLAVYAGALTPMKHDAITFLAQHRLMPEAYLYGWADILQRATDQPAMVFGHIFPTGQWFFFPGVFLIKSTLTLMILLLLVPIAGVFERRREFLFFAIPVVFFMGISIASMLNLGVRHILPIYPFCIVLAGAAAATLAARSMAGRVAIGALLAFMAVSSLHAFPDYLAYSNEAFGGPANTWKMVADANDDWGQGLKWTKSYMDQHPASDCWFDYFDPLVDPGYYGIHCKPLTSSYGFWLTPLTGRPLPSLPSTITGTLYISAAEASGLYWGPDSLNPYTSIVAPPGCGDRKRHSGLSGHL